MNTTRKMMATGLALAGLAVGPALATETIEAAGKIVSPVIQGSARVMAMDAASAGTADGADALQWNPAGLGSLAGPEAGLHHLTGIGGALGEAVIVGLPVGSLGGLAVSGEFTDAGELERRDEVGVETGRYGAGTTIGRLGWGKQMFGDVAVGAAFKASRQTLDTFARSAFAVDLGSLWKVNSALSVGAALTDLGMSSSASSLPMALRAGASYGLTLPAENRLLASAAAEVQFAGIQTVTVGAEDTFMGLLAVRAGYRLALSDQKLDGLTGLTAGLGLSYAGLALDYAWIPFGDLGNLQRVSLTYRRPPEAEHSSVKADGGVQ